jgi:hypothetical protein
MELHLELMSDALFGRGDGVPGLVDSDVEHDVWGLPYLKGRTLKGLLVEECGNILFGMSHSPIIGDMESAAWFLFGEPGSNVGDQGRLSVGDALLPMDIREAVEADVRSGRLSSNQILESLTAIRRQTAVDEETDAPARGSLRSLRVFLRGTVLISELVFDQLPDDQGLERGLLAACVLALRRAGTGRNRGFGRLEASLFEQDDEVIGKYFGAFRTYVEGADR